MRDPQLALLVCRLLLGPGSQLEAGLLRQLLGEVESHNDGSTSSGSNGRVGGGSGEGGSGAPDAVWAAAACHWLLGDGAAAAAVLLPGSGAGGGRGGQQQGQARGGWQHAVQLLPALAVLLPGVSLAAEPAHVPMRQWQQQQWQQRLRHACQLAAGALEESGLHAVALPLAVRAVAPQQQQGATACGGVQPPQQRLWRLAAAALLSATPPSAATAAAAAGAAPPTHAFGGGGSADEASPRHVSLDAPLGYQLSALQQQGWPLEAPPILSAARALRRHGTPHSAAAHGLHHAHGGSGSGGDGDGDGSSHGSSASSLPLLLLRRPTLDRRSSFGSSSVRNQQAKAVAAAQQRPRSAGSIVGEG